jgi:hypothetical protein
LLVSAGVAATGLPRCARLRARVQFKCTVKCEGQSVFASPACADIKPPASIPAHDGARQQGCARQGTGLRTGRLCVACVAAALCLQQQLPAAGLGRQVRLDAQVPEHMAAVAGALAGSGCSTGGAQMRYLVPHCCRPRCPAWLCATLSISWHMALCQFRSSTLHVSHIRSHHSRSAKASQVPAAAMHAHASKARVHVQSSPLVQRAAASLGLDRHTAFTNMQDVVPTAVRTRTM